MKRVIWIISEGSPGHVSQSEGLVAALGQRMSLETHVIQTRPRFGGFVRTLVRAWMGQRGERLPDRFIKRWLGCEIQAPAPDLIVTSGGKAVFAARSLALKYGVPLVFLGERKPYPSCWFHTVFTPSPFETDANDVSVEMIPTGITPASVEAAAAAWVEKPAGELWAMIIGGTSSTHGYAAADWKLLGEKLNQLAQTHGIRWLVSTSRRTGEAAEAILRQTIDPRRIAAAVWWAEKPEKRLAAFLGSAAWIFATQDSVTMVTEAVASGRPVVVTRPERVIIQPTSFLSGYFTRLEKASRIARIPFERLGDFQPATIKILPRSKPVGPELAATLLSRLGWE